MKALPTTALLCLTLCLGCGQSLHVTVQRIQPEGLAETGSVATISPQQVQAVYDSIGALNNYILLLRDVDAKLGAKTDEQSTQVRKDLHSRIDEAVSLLHDGQQKLRLLAVLPRADSVSVDPMSQSREADGRQRIQQSVIDLQLFVASVRNEIAWSGSQGTIAEAQRVLDSAGEQKQALNSQLSSIQQQASRAVERAAAPAFGGFVTTGIYQISPGDPMYARVLKGEPAGKPFTDVRSDAVGGSTIIFVQENPGQMRVFSMDMDATRLVQNVIYITDKVFQAAVKAITATGAL